MSGPFYHGGVPGLVVGAMVLPSGQTGARSNADYGAEKVCRRDRVYVTLNFADAVVFAAMHPSGKGRVYEVAPEGELMADPDCVADGGSFECERAHVVRFWEVSHKTRKRVRKAMLEGVR